MKSSDVEQDQGHAQPGRTHLEVQCQQPAGAQGGQGDDGGDLLVPQDRPTEREQHEAARGGRDAEVRGVPHGRQVRDVAQKLSMMLMTAGPMTATKRQGRMQKMSGTVILTGTCWAFSSAR